MGIIGFLSSRTTRSPFREAQDSSESEWLGSTPPPRYTPGDIKVAFGRELKHFSKRGHKCGVKCQLMLNHFRYISIKCGTLRQIGSHVVGDVVSVGPNQLACPVGYTAIRPCTAAQHKHSGVNASPAPISLSNDGVSACYRKYNYRSYIVAFLPVNLTHTHYLKCMWTSYLLVYSGLKCQASSTDCCRRSLYACHATNITLQFAIPQIMS